MGGWLADTFNAEKTGEDGEEEEGRGWDMGGAKGRRKASGIYYYAWNFSPGPKISVGLPSVMHITKVDKRVAREFS